MWEQILHTHTKKKKTRGGKREGLKLLISMPVDSFDYSSPCLLLPPLSVLCLFASWLWAVMGLSARLSFEVLGYQPSVELYLQPSVKGPPAAAHRSTSLP